MFKRSNINKIEILGIFLTSILCLGIYFYSINEAKKSSYFRTTILFEDTFNIFENYLSISSIYDDFDKTTLKNNLSESLTKEFIAHEFYDLFTMFDNKKKYFEQLNNEIKLINARKIINSLEVVYMNHTNVIQINYTTPNHIDHIKIYNSYLDFTEKEYKIKLQKNFTNYYKNLQNVFNELILNNLTELSFDVSFSYKQYAQDYDQVSIEILDYYDGIMKKNFEKLKYIMNMIKENLIFIQLDEKLNSQDEKLNSQYEKNSNFISAYLSSEKINGVFEDINEFFKQDLSKGNNVKDYEFSLIEIKNKILFISNFIDKLNNLLVNDYLGTFKTTYSENNANRASGDGNLTQSISDIIFEIEFFLQKINSINEFQANFYTRSDPNMINIQIEQLEELKLIYKNNPRDAKDFIESINNLESHKLTFTSYVDNLQNLNDKLLINSENELIVMDRDFDVVLVTNKITNKYEKLRAYLIKQIRLSEKLAVNSSSIKKMSIRGDSEMVNLFYTNNIVNAFISLLIILIIISIFFIVKKNISFFNNKD